ncbi:hypothetical protein IEQ34_022251 [Dendrobium chrysotoxum]|uniref:Uncharacterized protein n=1 Tax=Dendrobium chrysotoxum TaxID=161865 RepID=A0AAV7FWQ7_DENCH|nr:hypothetical protein IEQ34_022251 [Dendrobium chrysotoxum]
MPLWGAGADGLIVLPRSHLVAAGFRSPSPDFRLVPSIPVDSRTSFFNKCCHFGWPKIGICLESRHFHSLKVRALENSGQSQMPVAPLQFQSPTGQLLSQIMQTHPHLLPAAIDQQLDQLQSDRDTQKLEKPPPSQDPLLYRSFPPPECIGQQATTSGSFQTVKTAVCSKIWQQTLIRVALDSKGNIQNTLDSNYTASGSLQTSKTAVWKLEKALDSSFLLPEELGSTWKLPNSIWKLEKALDNNLGAWIKAWTAIWSARTTRGRRIAEVREKDRQKSLEEIVYCFIVQKFLENDILMIPKISPSAYPTGQVDLWPNQGQKLEAIHSPDAMEMIQSHLTLILGERVIGPLNTIVQISKLKLGKLYAASIMYGYFLKRVDERYQLERTMNTLPKRIPDQRILDGLKPNPLWDMDSLVMISPDEDIDGEQDEKSYKLRSYVMYLDAETLHRYATIRSNEAVSLIEKQTQALFGRPDIKIADDGTLDASNDEVVGISFSGLTMLVLEAVAFGSFLWEAESYVESKYHFLTN